MTGTNTKNLLMNVFSLIWLILQLPLRVLFQRIKSLLTISGRYSRIQFSKQLKLHLQPTALEDAHKTKLIAEYEESRCADYAVNKAAFITSSLNKSKRSIILNRAMNVNNNNETVLETALHKVKTLANNHFRTVAGIPLKPAPTIDDMSDRWQQAYLPQDDIDPTIYNDLLDPPTDEEWQAAIKALPNGKAAGLSGIPYKLLKELLDEASLYLKLLIPECFNSNDIPSH